MYIWLPKVRILQLIWFQVPQGFFIPFGQEFTSLAERLKARNRRKPSYAEVEAAEDEYWAAEEEVEEEEEEEEAAVEGAAADADDEFLEVLKMEQVCVQMTHTQVHHNNNSYVNFFCNCLSVQFCVFQKICICWVVALGTS
jgi:hypothetical protein